MINIIMILLAIFSATCSPPAKWNKTKRLLDNKTITSTFTIDQPASVKIKIFWFQDYDKNGCPYDCAGGECQGGETGKAKTPCGTVNITDGKDGANNGNKTVKCDLSPGTYVIELVHTGGQDSLNVGYEVVNEPSSITSTPTEVKPTSTPTLEITPTMYVVTPPTTPTNPPGETPTPEITETFPPPGKTPPKKTPPPTLPPPPTPKEPTRVVLPVSGSANRRVTCLGPAGLLIGFVGFAMLWKRKDGK